MAGDANDHGPTGDASPPVDGDAAVVRGDEPPSARVPLSRERIVNAAVDVHRRPRTARSVDAETGDDARGRGDGAVPLRSRSRAAARCRGRTDRRRDGRGSGCAPRAPSTGGRTTCNDSPTASDESRWPIRRRSRWSRPGRRRRHGCVRRCGACAGWRPSSTASRHEGFSDAPRVEAYRAFTSFLLGHLLLEVAALGADLGPLDVVEEDVDKTLAPYPNVRRLREPLREDHSATEFEDSLENLLQRLALIRTEN